MANKTPNIVTESVRKALADKAAEYQSIALEMCELQARLHALTKKSERHYVDGLTLADWLDNEGVGDSRKPHMKALRQMASSAAKLLENAQNVGEVLEVAYEPIFILPEVKAEAAHE